MKTIIHEFDPIIYPYKIWVIVSKTPDIISDNFNEYDGKTITTWENTENFDAFAIPVRNKENNKFGCILYFRSKKSMTYNIIAHESSHASKYLFDHISADVKEHEPFEYVIGWIAECCGKVKLNKI